MLAYTHGGFFPCRVPVSVCCYICDLVLNIGIFWGLCWGNFAPERIYISFFQVPNGTQPRLYHNKFSIADPLSHSLLWLQTYIKDAFGYVFLKDLFPFFSFSLFFFFPIYAY